MFRITWLARCWPASEVQVDCIKADITVSHACCLQLMLPGSYIFLNPCCGYDQQWNIKTFPWSSVNELVLSLPLAMVVWPFGALSGYAGLPTIANIRPLENILGLVRCIILTFKKQSNELFGPAPYSLLSVWQHPKPWCTNKYHVSVLSDITACTTVLWY